MELGGAEKRIQALFSELSLEDRTHVPGFEKLWTRAEATRPPARAFSRSIAVIAAIVVATAMSLSLWSWSRTSEVALNIAPQEIPDLALSRPPQVAIVVEPSKPLFQRQKTRVQKRRSEMSEVQLFSSWQSPTQSFMQAPTSVVFNSLPQLNQSAIDLESFLPKNNEVMKESNQ